MDANTYWQRWNARVTSMFHPSHAIKSYGHDGVACGLCGIRAGEAKALVACPADTCPTCGLRSVKGKLPDYH